MNKKEIMKLSCLSVYSYIKPQPMNKKEIMKLSCLSVYSYIKPQLPCSQ